MSAEVTETLEACAELLEDLTEPVYARFFATSATGQSLMDHSDEYMKGRMLQQVLELLMGDSADEGYLPWEVKNHVQAYSVQLDMYPDFFAAVKATVADTLGNRWTEAANQAWDAKIASLLEQIREVAPA